ncbi:MAG: flagellar motor protein MotD [Pseudomonadales bacterium]|nr:flagellar motor protein MotD [Pseudomonadales bacterium]
MSRRYQEIEPENQERWVVSYADFITLLFAFFVVMYSVSSVNEGKYKVLSESLENVFTATSKTPYPVVDGQKDARALKNMDQIIVFPVPGDYASDREYEYGIEGLEEDVKPGDGKGEEGVRGEALADGLGEGTGHPESEEESIAQFNNLRSGLLDGFQHLIEDGTLSVKGNDQYIEIEIKNSVLFKSGSAETSQDARFVLRKIANLLGKNKNSIQVEGFTDNVPIKSAKYPSNWELSTARASSIVRMLMLSNISPQRLAAVGYGEYQPIADNDSVEGRKQNRRVALIISRDENIRRDSHNALSIEEAEKEKGIFNPFQVMADSIVDAVVGKAKQTENQNNEIIESKPKKEKTEVLDRAENPFRLKSGGLLFTADPKGRIDIADE